MSVSYISNADATAGHSLMLEAITAMVIGRASLFGGNGSAIDALMITIIQNGTNLISMNSFCPFPMATVRERVQWRAG